MISATNTRVIGNPSPETSRELASAQGNPEAGREGLARSRAACQRDAIEVMEGNRMSDDNHAPPPRTPEETAKIVTDVQAGMRELIQRIPRRYAYGDDLGLVFNATTARSGK
jgi:hypothetical protein